MGTAEAVRLREIAEAVRRVTSPSFSGTRCQAMRAAADLIRQAFEIGAFQHGPYCKIGDNIRPWLVGIEHTVPLQDGFKTPVWVPIVWYAVADSVAPKLCHQRRKLPKVPGDWNVLPTKAEVEAVADAITEEADRLGSPQRKRPRISRDEANLRAREALKARTEKWTVRKLAQMIGCSVGLVPKLPAWQAYQEELNKHKPPKAPKAVSLTDAVLDNEGRNDETLEKLISEQQADFEENPLVSNARKLPRRRPKV